MKESRFQSLLIKEIKKRFPGAVVMKTNANQLQGFPDLIILYGSKWATLECKRTKKAKHQPNQDMWVARLAKMSFGRFIYPENKQEVLDDLERSFS